MVTMQGHLACHSCDSLHTLTESEIHALFNRDKEEVVIGRLPNYLHIQFQMFGLQIAVVGHSKL